MILVSAVPEPAPNKASVAPPPFPFTPFVMAAAALQYSRCKMLVVVGVSRMVRFAILGLLALRFGVSLLRWAQSPVVHVTHSHGLEIRPEFDGTPDTWFSPNVGIRGPEFVSNTYDQPSSNQATAFWSNG